MRQVVTTARRPALVLLAAISLGACFTSTADYRKEAEAYIVENARVADELGVALVSATCAEPADQKVGTEFTCTAIDENGATWSFDVVIAASRRIDVSVSDRP